MQFIKFNDAESAQERSQTHPLSLEQEREVIEVINTLIGEYTLEKDDFKKVQDFVNHYQNMSHLCTINGLFGIVWDGSSDLANKIFGENYGVDWSYLENSTSIKVKERIIQVGDEIFKADTSKGGYQPTNDTMNHIPPSGDDEESNIDTLELLKTIHQNVDWSTMNWGSNQGHVLEQKLEKLINSFTNEKI